jgi:glycosyltransferase involved in cell wall biosynthesis
VDRLAIVVPCYNEEEMLRITSETLSKLIDELIGKNKIAEDSFVLFVNDGSKDNTWNLIEQEHVKQSHIFGLKLAGNVGHQYALTAGLVVAKDMADVMISIDADLQDDIDVIEEMIDKFHLGNDIVYGVRSNRKSDSFFKRFTAQFFYKFMNWMGVKTIYNHADFRLMSKRAVDYFAKFEETNLFLRGMMPLIGYKTDSVYYKRKERVAGESKYPLKKMIALALNGITSFSIKPITFIFNIGLIIVFLCIVTGIYALISHCTGNTVPGWTSLMLSLWFIGGVQLLCLGLLGEYIGKIYIEVKKRPRYNVEIVLDDLNQK